MKKHSTPPPELQPTTPEVLVHIAALVERDSVGLEQRCARYRRRVAVYRTVATVCVVLLIVGVVLWQRPAEIGGKPFSTEARMSTKELIPITAQDIRPDKTPVETSVAHTNTAIGNNKVAEIQIVSDSPMPQDHSFSNLDRAENLDDLSAEAEEQCNQLLCEDWCNSEEVFSNISYFISQIS